MDQTWWKSADQLDNDQKAIINLPIDGSNLIVGPPGSGKTNLLLLRAAFMARAGRPNIAIITYNRLLKEFISSGSTHYPFEASRIQTFVSWGNSLLKSNGIAPVHLANFDDTIEQIIDSLKNLLSSGATTAKYDCIFVDEAQDYGIDEIELFRQFSNNLYAVGDNNQRIYAQGGAIAHLETFCTVPTPLKYHYRNGQAICKFADAVKPAGDERMLDTCNYDEKTYPSSVTRTSNLSITQQVAAAIPQLTSQLLAYPDEWIGVLAPTNSNVGAVHDALLASPLSDKVQLQNNSVGYDALDATKPIIVSTMHSSKGLEYRAVHLFAFDNITALSNSRRVAFTAITRAKTSLSVYHNGAVPGYIESGLQAVRGAPTTMPTLTDLFGAI